MARAQSEGVYVDANVYRAAIFVIMLLFTIVGYMIKGEYTKYNDRISRVEEKTDVIAENVTKIGVKFGIDVKSMTVAGTEQCQPPPEKKDHWPVYPERMSVFAMAAKAEDFVYRRERKYRKW